MGTNRFNQLFVWGLCVLCVMFMCAQCDDDDDDSSYMDLEGSAWSFTITIPSGLTYPGTFSVSNQSEGSISGFGTLEIAYISAEFNMDGWVDEDDNMGMHFDLLDPQWVDMDIYSCKCQGNTMSGLARSNNWQNATFHASRR